MHFPVHGHCGESATFRSGHCTEDSQYFWQCWQYSSSWYCLQCRQYSISYFSLPCWKSRYYSPYLHSRYWLPCWQSRYCIGCKHCQQQRLRRATGPSDLGVSVFQRLLLIQSVPYLFLDLFASSIKHLSYSSRPLLCRTQPSQQCTNLCDPRSHSARLRHVFLFSLVANVIPKVASTLRKIIFASLSPCFLLSICPFWRADVRFASSSSCSESSHSDTLFAIAISLGSILHMSDVCPMALFPETISNGINGNVSSWANRLIEMPK